MATKRKRAIVGSYLQAIEEIEGIRPLLPYDLKENAYWLFGVRTKERDRIIRHLNSQRIATGGHFMPLGLHPLFSEYNQDLHVSNAVWEELLTPLFHLELTDDEVNRVGVALGEALACA